MLPEKCPVCKQKPAIIDGNVSPDFVVQNFVAKGLESLNTVGGLYSLNVEMPQAFIDTIGSKLWTSLVMDRMAEIHEKQHKFIPLEVE